MPDAIDVTFLTKPGCHLCDEARVVLDETVADWQETSGGTVSVTEKSIADDPQLRVKYAEDIPVVLINGRMHTYWRIDAQRLANALTAAAGSVRGTDR